jgi:nicotinamide riboside transporter PnuC
MHAQACIYSKDIKNAYVYITISLQLTLNADLSLALYTVCPHHMSGIGLSQYHGQKRLMQMSMHMSLALLCAMHISNQLWLCYCGVLSVSCHAVAQHPISMHCVSSEFNATMPLDCAQDQDQQEHSSAAHSKEIRRY